MNATDRSEIRRKALLAASSVTLAVWMPACKVVPYPGDLTDGGDTDAGDTDPVSTDGGDTDVSQDSGQDTDLLADTDIASDTDWVADTDTGDSGIVVDVEGPKPDCTALNLTINACCNALIDWCTVNAPPDTGTDDYNECVYGPTFDGSTGCIPWGPPVPPAASVA